MFPKRSPTPFSEGKKEICSLDSLKKPQLFVFKNCEIVGILVLKLALTVLLHKIETIKASYHCENKLTLQFGESF